MDGPGTERASAGGGSTLLAGLAAGCVGGLAMAGWMVAAAALDGREPFAALRPIGATFRAAAASTGEGGLAYALALHLLVAAAVGVVLTGMLPRALEPRFASAICVGFALGVMAIMTSYVLPAYNPSLRAHMPELGGAWVNAHAVYGACVGFVAQRLRQRAAAGRVPAAEAVHGRREDAPAPRSRPAAAARR